MSSLKGKTIVFTGTLNMKRTDATTKATNAGANVTNAVSGKTDILVAGPGAGSKMADAQKKGVAVWTEDEFVAALSAKGGAAKKAAPTKKEETKAAAPAKKATAGKKSSGGDALSGKTIVFTGTLSQKRAEAKAAAEGAGAKVTAAISGKTDIVVAGADAGEKLVIAQNLGVTIYTEDEFNAAVNGGDAPAPAKKTAPKAAEAKATGKKKKVEDIDEDEEEEAPPKKVAKKTATETASAPKSGGGGGGRVVDRCVSGRGEYSVYKDFSITLNQTNIGGNNNKYYIIQVLQKGNNFFAYNRWGRVGEDGQQALKPFGGSESGAIGDFEKKFKDKSGGNTWSGYKGGSFTKKDGKYQVVETEEKEGGGDDTQPMGKLTKAQIEKGQKVLEKLGDAINGNKGKSKYNEFSSEFYSLIPHDFGRKVPPAIEDMDTVHKKEELLKFYLRMGFEEVEEKDTGLTPIDGVMKLDVPKTLEDAIKNACPISSIKQSVFQGSKLADKQAGKPVRTMSKEHYGSIMLYTSNAIYKDLNKVLRDEKRKAVEKYFKYLRLLFDAADTLPQKKVQLWRGIGVDLFSQYKVGETITWWGVSSCTSEQKVARNFMNNCGGDCTFLTIDTKTAVDISDLSFYSNEKESLLMPGTQLKVKSAKKNGKVAEIHLEEVGRAVS